MKRSRLAIVISLVIGTVLAGFAGAAGSSVAASGVTVQLFEFKLIPKPATATAGKVTFVVRNTGKQHHEFVVIKTKTPASKLLKGNEADETGAVGELGDVKPGQTLKLVLKLKAGHYALICNLPGHYKAGQYANFVVK